MLTILKKNMAQILTIIIFGSVLVFPFSLSLLSQLFHLSQRGFSGLFSLLLGISLLFLVIFVYRKFDSLIPLEKYNKNKINVFSIVFLVAITVLFRLLLINIFKTPPASDFYLAFEAAQRWVDGPSLSVQHFFFQHWGFYALFLSKFFVLFGKSVFVAKLANILCASIAVAAIYLTLYKITRNFKIGIMGGLLLSLWPSYAAYSNILSGEHFFIMFFCLMIYLLLLIAFAIQEEHYWKAISLTILFSIFFGLTNSFKETTIIMMPITLFTFPFLLLQREKVLKKAILKILLFVFVIIFGSFVTVKVLHMTVSHYAMGPVNNHKTWYFMMTGLNIETGGRYNAEIAKKYTEPLWQAALENRINDDIYKESDNEIKKMVINSIKRDHKEYPQFFIKKYYAVWASEEEINNWLYESYELMDKNADTMHVRERVAQYNFLSNMYFVFIIIAAVLGCLSLLKTSSKNINATFIFCGLFIFGFSFALLFIEILTRYRSILYPSITLFAALGIVYAKKFLKI